MVCRLAIATLAHVASGLVLPTVQPPPAIVQQMATRTAVSPASLSPFPTLTLAEIDKESEAYKAAYAKALEKARAEAGLKAAATATAPAPAPAPAPSPPPPAPEPKSSGGYDSIPETAMAPPPAPAPKAAEPEKLSKAQAKIQAAKQSTASRAAAGGYSGAKNEGEAKSLFDVSGLTGGGEKSPYAEADALREKINELKAQQYNKPLSKSKSALLAQYRQMEVRVPTYTLALPCADLHTAHLTRPVLLT